MDRISQTDYLNDPCKTSSLPFWKTNAICLPDNIIVLRDDVFHNYNVINGIDEPYFKLIHRLENNAEPILPPGFEVIETNIDVFSSHINKCYKEEGITPEGLKEYLNHRVYDKDLWIAVKDIRTNEVVATGIGELDTDISEGVLEWIQVSPDYRKKGLGRYVVNELLYRLSKKATFVTVSGKMKSESCPLKLYKSCGFKNMVIWHIIKTNE